MWLGHGAVCVSPESCAGSYLERLGNSELCGHAHSSRFTGCLIPQPPVPTPPRPPAHPRPCAGSSEARAAHHQIGLACPLCPEVLPAGLSRSSYAAFAAISRGLCRGWLGVKKEIGRHPGEDYIPEHIVLLPSYSPMPHSPSCGDGLWV